MQDAARKEANTALQKAKKADKPSTKDATVIRNYNHCVNKILDINNKIDDDFRNLESAYERLAVYHFNKYSQEGYQQARDCYISAIKSLSELKNTTDADLRKFTQHYIDLSVVFIDLGDRTQSDIARNYAMEAFLCIKIKTQTEKNLGNIKINHTAFINHFQQKTASDAYLNSVHYKNHEKLLVNTQEENNLLQSFDNIYIDEDKMFEKTMERDFNTMSIASVQKPLSFFSAFSVEKPKDTAYRTLALEYVSLAKNHLHNDLFNEAIKTYNEALDALGKIQQKDTEDINYMQSIREYIKYTNKLREEQSPKYQFPSFFAQYNEPKPQLNSNNNNLFGNHEIQQELWGPNNDYHWEDYSDTNMHVEHQKQHF